jgi:hypothetical protein
MGLKGAIFSFHSDNVIWQHQELQKQSESEEPDWSLVVCGRPSSVRTTISGRKQMWAPPQFNNS